jgi:hypothetical protein
LDNTIDVEIDEDLTDEENLENISKEIDRSIEVHTQDYDEPIVKYNEVNENEPLRLFYNQDSDEYQPIVNRKKGKRGKSINPPNKRKKMLNVYTHPDLEVLWKVKEHSIDLEKNICQGVLDVDINWNEKKWYDKLEQVKQFIDDNDRRPLPNSKNKDEKQLGIWISTQTTNYKKQAYIMADDTIRQQWTDFINDPKYKQYFVSNEDNWLNNLEQVKQFIDDNDRKPLSNSKNNDEKQLGQWISTQTKNYKKQAQIMADDTIRQQWTDFINDPKYKQYFTTAKQTKQMDKPQPKIKIKIKKTDKPKRNKSQSMLSTLHKKYKTMNSENLHKHFKENKDDWSNYHKIAEENEKSFPEEEIPYNRVIKYLESIPGKRNKTVVDLGCGKARVSEHFKNNKRFEFHNFDHIACNETVIERDIRNTELEEYSVDIAILCLAMWGSNCKDYLEEAYRILDKGGRLIIVEAFKRWNEQIEGEETIENKLVKLLEDNKFTIVKNDEQKFMFIECRKV